ncbi:hypothetical protein EV421DRAFT_2016197 [Armillaria borealis]|uniref:Uncharacterized protein n=1 Tax=Armillaria borealis TaxID=47425 RepID=A0AA39MXP6_9AGAR|nr:hypothetical protein EV421DRAFT_2016197 [Armillaria borealis]
MIPGNSAEDASIVDEYKRRIFFSKDEVASIRIQRDDDGGHTLESLITCWIMTLTVTKTSLFPLLVYAFLLMAGHLQSVFLPTHFDSPSFLLPKFIAFESILQVQEPRYRLKNVCIGKNVNEGSTRVFGCGKLLLADGRPQGKLLVAEDFNIDYQHISTDLDSKWTTISSSKAQDVEASGASIVTGDFLNFKNGVRSDSELAELRRRKKLLWSSIDRMMCVLWINTSDVKDEEELARLWVKVVVWASLISKVALCVFRCMWPFLLCLATSIDFVFDIGSNVVLFWLHLKAEKLDMNRLPVGGAHLENIGNIVYGFFVCSSLPSPVMSSVNLIVVVESVRSPISKEDDELKDFHIPSIIAVAAALRTACPEKRDENGYKIILFKVERLPGQPPAGTGGKFWAYPESDAPTKMLKVLGPSAPKKTLFPTPPKLPSFNKSSPSSYTLPRAPLSPVPAVKVEKYCDEALQYPVTIPLLQYPEVDVETRHNISMRASTSPPLRIKDGSPPEIGELSAILFPANTRKSRCFAPTPLFVFNVRSWLAGPCLECSIPLCRGGVGILTPVPEHLFGSEDTCDYSLMNKHLGHTAAISLFPTTGFNDDGNLFSDYLDERNFGRNTPTLQYWHQRWPLWMRAAVFEVWLARNEKKKSWVECSVAVAEAATQLED